MVIEKLKNKVVFLDTAPLIYFIEGNSAYQENLKKVFEYNDDGYFKFITSPITVFEVLVKPIKLKETQIVGQYKTILTEADGIDIYDITTSISIRAAEIRAKYSIPTPDAIQIATSIDRQAQFFLTNDNRLRSITEIKVISISELA